MVIAEGGTPCFLLLATHGSRFISCLFCLLYRSIIDWKPSIMCTSALCRSSGVISRLQNNNNCTLTITAVSWQYIHNPSHSRNTSQLTSPSQSPWLSSGFATLPLDRQTHTMTAENKSLCHAWQKQCTCNTCCIRSSPWTRASLHSVSSSTQSQLSTTWSYPLLKTEILLWEYCIVMFFTDNSISLSLIHCVTPFCLLFY